MSFDNAAFSMEIKFSFLTIVKACTFYNDWIVHNFDEEVKIVHLS